MVIKDQKGLALILSKVEVDSVSWGLLWLLPRAVPIALYYSRSNIQKILVYYVELVLRHDNLRLRYQDESISQKGQGQAFKHGWAIPSTACSFIRRRIGMPKTLVQISNITLATTHTTEMVKFYNTLFSAELRPTDA